MKQSTVPTIVILITLLMASLGFACSPSEVSPTVDYVATPKADVTKSGTIQSTVTPAAGPESATPTLVPKTSTTITPPPTGTPQTPDKKRSGRRVPKINETVCTPSNPSIGESVECYFSVSGKIDTISWSTPDGNPQIGIDKHFVSSFDVSGPTSITLEVCNGSSCTKSITEIDVSSTQTGGNTPESGQSVLHTSLKGCEGQGPTLFSSSPIPIDAISWIEPLGKMNPMGGHVTPTDHIYVHYIDSYGFPPPYELRALADGYIVHVERRPDWTPENAGVLGVLKDWRLVFEHTCTFFSVYIHIKELAPGLLEYQILQGSMQDQTLWDLDAIPSSELTDNVTARVRIPVQAGQLIGMVGGQDSFDIQVVDMEVALGGFVIPGHYTEPWKTYTGDFFQYLDPQIKSQLEEKNPRSAEPRGGEIDYDIDGRLVGNWFMEGSEDYAGGGLKDTLGYCGSIPCPYWLGHLTIAYDNLDPTQIRVSNGADWEHGPFGVKGNGPNPADVGVEDGLVEYELLELKHVQIPGFPSVSKTVSDGTTIVGTMLVQMLDDRTMRMEVFPDLPADLVSIFSTNAKNYFR